MAYVNPPNTVFAGAGLQQIPSPGPGNNGATSVILSMINPGGFPGYYGSFYDTTTQTNIPVDTAHPMRLNSTTAAYGVSVVDGSKIQFQYSGIYDIQFSAQFSKTTGTDHDVDIWFVLNGTNIPHSNTRITLFGSNSKSAPAWNILVPLSAGDQLQIVWSSSFSSMEMLAQGPQTGPDRPEIPSVIVTAQLVREL